MRDEPDFDPGFARHICHGNLQQFLLRDWIKDGLPSLGFYGENADMVDSYSCVASPMWCFKYFSSLFLREDNPFWCAAESEGWWGRIDRYEIRGTGMCVVHDETNSTLYSPQRRQGDLRYEKPFYQTDEKSESVTRAGHLDVGYEGGVSA